MMMTMMASRPGDEDKENEKCAEGGDAVHGLEHDDQLVLESRHEPHQLEDAQQAERA